MSTAPPAETNPPPQPETRAEPETELAATAIKSNLGPGRGAVIATVLIVACALGAGLWWYFTNAGLRISISEEQILERLNQKLPLRKTYLYVFEVTYDSPRVELVEASERINAGLDISVKINFLSDSTPLLGKIDASAGIRYEPTEGAFYLTDANIEALDLEGLPREWTAKGRDLVGQGIHSYFEEHPIYRLTDREAHRAARAVLQNLTIGQDKVVLHLGPKPHSS